MQECSCFQNKDDGLESGGVKEVVRLDMPGAPIFSLALDPSSANTGRQQVFILSRTFSVLIDFVSRHT